MIINIQSGK